VEQGVVDTAHCDCLLCNGTVWESLGHQLTCTKIPPLTLVLPTERELPYTATTSCSTHTKRRAGHSHMFCCLKSPAIAVTEARAAVAPTTTVVSTTAGAPAIAVVEVRVAIAPTKTVAPAIAVVEVRVAIAPTKTVAPAIAVVEVRVAIAPTITVAQTTTTTVSSTNTVAPAIAVTKVRAAIIPAAVEEAEAGAGRWRCF